MGWPVNSQSGNHFDYLLCILISWLNAIELQWNPALWPRRYYSPFYWSPGKNCHTFSCKKTLVNMANLLIPPIFLGPLVTILTGFHWTWVTCLIHAIPHWSLPCKYLVSFMLVFALFLFICYYWTNILFDRRLVSSVGRAPVCRAGGCGFKPQPNQHSGSLNNWEESAAFVMTSANG